MPSRPHPLRALALTLAAATLAGCGNERTPAPDVARIGPPLGTTPQAIPEAGLRFRTPDGWRLTKGAPGEPLVATISTGLASIAVWRYPRSERLPRTQPELETARQSLLDAVRARDPGYLEERSRVLRSRPAVELFGTQTIHGSKRRVRSTHVFVHGAEIVVDAFAPPEDFARVDRSVFSLLTASLQIRAPRAAPAATP